MRRIVLSETREQFHNMNVRVLQALFRTGGLVHFYWYIFIDLLHVSEGVDWFGSLAHVWSCEVVIHRISPNLRIGPSVNLVFALSAPFTNEMLRSSAHQNHATRRVGLECPRMRSTTDVCGCRVSLAMFTLNLFHEFQHLENFHVACVLYDLCRH